MHNFGRKTSILRTCLLLNRFSTLESTLATQNEQQQQNPSGASLKSNLVSSSTSPLINPYERQREIPLQVQNLAPQLPLAEKRDVSLTGLHSTGFFFNTHHMVKLLCQQGFTLNQAEAVTDLLTHIVTAQTEVQFKNNVSKEQLEISVQQLLAQLDSIKKDMLILEKSQFATLRHDLDKLLLNINQLQSKLTDECAKLKGGFALDMNLEKSRTKEDEHKLQSEIQELTNRIGLEVANMRADIAHLRANFESSRTDIIKYVARTATGTIVSVCTIGFLIYRFVS